MRAKDLQIRLVEIAFWETLDTERSVLLTVTYVLLLIVAMICVYVNLIFGIKFQHEQNVAWLQGVFIGLVTGTVMRQCVVSFSA